MACENTSGFQWTSSTLTRCCCGASPALRLLPGAPLHAADMQLPASVVLLCSHCSLPSHMVCLGSCRAGLLLLLPASLTCLPHCGTRGSERRRTDSAPFPQAGRRGAHLLRDMKHSLRHRRHSTSLRAPGYRWFRDADWMGRRRGISR